MTRVMEITVYAFDELTPEVQGTVIERWRHDDTFPWYAEWQDSLDTFCEYAPLRVRDWCVGYPGTHVSFDMTGDYGEEVGELSDVRAWKWLVNNGWAELVKKSCPFTGYCGDEALLDPIREALAHPATITSLRDVFRNCLYSWAKDYEQDLDYWYSAECIREEIEANGYEFHADGSLV